MDLRGLAFGIIYQTRLHLAEADWFLFLSPTVFTQVCLAENTATIPTLCYVIWGWWGFFSEQSNAWTEPDASCFPNMLCTNKSKLSSHSFRHMHVHWNHAHQWLKTTGDLSIDWNLPSTGEPGCQLRKHGRDYGPMSRVFKWVCHICVYPATGGRSSYKPRSWRLRWWAWGLCSAWSVPLRLQIRFSVRGI